jgi:hypothetical protein
MKAIRYPAYLIDGEYVLQEAPLGGGHGSRSMVAEKWLFS